MNAENAIIETAGLRPVYDQIERIATARLPVLIVGETGVGKRHLAERLHRRSGRARFVWINCAAIETTRFVSEFFGSLDAGGDGTVLLDEVGELSPELQVRLLRALASDESPLRLVATSNRDLAPRPDAPEGGFRPDLYHRLAGLRLQVPSLRERPDDIVPLAEHFLAAICREQNLPDLRLAPSALAALATQRWAGNVRELRHVIERGALFAQDGQVAAEHLDLPPEPGAPASAPGAEWTARLRPITRDTVVGALAACAGNQTLAAVRLGVGRRTLSRWLDRLEIPRPRKSVAANGLRQARGGA